MFQLGALFQDAGATAAPGRSTRSASSATGIAGQDEEPGFEDFLAMAAMLAGQPLDQPSAELPHDIEAIVGPIIDAPSPLLADSDENNSPEIRNLLRAYDLAPDIPDPTAILAVETQTHDLSHASLLLPDISGETNLEAPFDFRAFASTHKGLEGAAIARPDYGTGITRIDSIGAGMKKFDEGGLVTPDLRLVIRNDKPVQSSGERLAAPDLRVIDFGPPTATDSLIDRLAGEWEHSFLQEYGGTIDSDVSDVMTPPVLFGDRNGQRARFGAHDLSPDNLSSNDGDSPRPVRIRPDMNVSDYPATGDSDQQGRDPESSDQWSRETSEQFIDPEFRLWAAKATSGEQADNPSISTVPLFGDFLPIDADAGSADLEPAVSVRQAALEVSKELRHLERNGGSELSFSLRLHPEHLGQVEIEIQRVNDVWSVSIVAANDEARDALAAEISRLENRFQQHDFTLESINVVTRDPEELVSASTANDRSARPDLDSAQQQMFDHRQNRDQSGWRKDDRDRILGIDSSHDAGSEQEVTTSHGHASGPGIDIKA